MKPPQASLISALIGFIAVSAPTAARVVTISHSPRPLVDAMETTRKLFHVPITYEDTRYRNAKDLGPASEVILQYTRLPLGMPVIRQHAISFELQDPQPDSKADVKFKLALATMRSAVASSNRARGADLFGLVVSDGFIHVVRRGFIDRSAHFQREAGVLDSRISLHIDRNVGLDDAIDLIMSHQPKTAQKVEVGGYSAGLKPPLVAQPMDFKNVTIRDALTTLSRKGFGRGGIEFTWQLLCDQGPVCSLTAETNPFAPDLPAE